jgi:hypothetical protein
MPVPRKYDQETRHRAARTSQHWRRAFRARASGVSTAVGELLDINPGTLWGWVARVEVDSRARPGSSSEAAAKLLRCGVRSPSCVESATFPEGVSVCATAWFDRQLRWQSFYIGCYRHGFGAVPTCRALCQHDGSIGSSTYYAKRSRPVSGADWDDGQAARLVLDPYWADRSV